MLVALKKLVSHFSRKTNYSIEVSFRLRQGIGQSLWNYSLFFNFRSQFAKGYRFSEDQDTDETIRVEETRFFSPAFIQIGPSHLWKKSNEFNINIAPVTYRIIMVDRQFTTTPNYVSGNYFGVDSGQRWIHSRVRKISDCKKYYCRKHTAPICQLHRSP